MSTALAIKRDLFISDTLVPEAPQPEDTGKWSGQWTGTTIRCMFRLEPLAGHPGHQDKLVKTRETARPEDIASDVWCVLPQAPRATEIERWNGVCDNWPAARAIRGQSHIPETEKEERQRVINESSSGYTLPLGPAMTVVQVKVAIAKSLR